MDQSPVTPSGTARRTIVAAAGATGIAAVLAACGGSNSNSAGGSSDTTAPASSGGSSGGSTGGSSGGDSMAGMALGAATDIPEGGGKVFAEHKVVVTQPSAGTYKAFSAVCTHAGCTVNEVANGTINCPCHGSKFSIKDGSVAAGPAPAPLAAQKIDVQGGQVKMA